MDGVFWAVDDSQRKLEFTGKICDISANGIKVVPDKKYESIISSLNVGQKLLFSSFDDYKIYQSSRMDFVQGEAVIKWIVNKPTDISLGCYIDKPSKELREYVENKKVAGFIDSGYLII